MKFLFVFINPPKNLKKKNPQPKLLLGQSMEEIALFLLLNFFKSRIFSKNHFLTEIRECLLATITGITAILLLGCDASLKRLDKTSVDITEAPSEDQKATSEPQQTTSLPPNVELPQSVSQGERPAGSISEPPVSTKSEEIDQKGENPSPQEENQKTNNREQSETIKSESQQGKMEPKEPPIVRSLKLGDLLLLKGETEFEYDVTSEKNYTIKWLQLSGPAALSIKPSPKERRLLVSGSADGIYELQGQLIVDDQVVYQDKKTLIRDTNGPQHNGGLYTYADSPNGPDTRIDDDTDVYLAWDPFFDSLHNPLAHIIVLFTQSNCGGPAKDISIGSNSGLNYFRTTQGADSSISFKLKVYDSIGNFTETNCSNSIRSDLTPPIALTDIKATKGISVETVSIKLTFPEAIQDFFKLQLVRGVPVEFGDNPIPPVDCYSGTKILEKSTFSPNEVVSIIDDIERAGYHVAYRVCVQDLAGNKSPDVIITQDHIDGGKLTSKEHILLTTSTKYHGNLASLGGGLLSGLEAADAECRFVASHSSSPHIQSETNWKAVLSDEFQDARRRLIISGVVKDQPLQSVIAQNRQDLWDGLINSSVFFNENGGNEGFVWTGSDGFGNRTSTHCLNWTSSLISHQGKQGDSFSSTDFNWMSTLSPFADDYALCSEERGLYCVSQPPNSDWSGPNYQAQGNPYSIQFTIPGILRSDMPQLEIWKILGLVAPDIGCYQKSTEVKIHSMALEKAMATFSDSNIVPGETYSYRFCLKDEFGNILTSKAITGVSGI